MDTKEYYRRIGRLGGLKRAKRLSKKRRKEISKMANEALFNKIRSMR